MIDATPFATTTAGAVLLPSIGALLVALIIYLVRKLGTLLAGINDAAELARDVKTAQDEFKADVFERLDGQDGKLAAIDAETRLNGGSSLKDAVLRTEAAVAANGDRLTAHLEDAKYQQGRVDGYIAAHP